MVLASWVHTVWRGPPQPQNLLTSLLPVFSYITLPSFLPQGLCTCPSPTARMTPIPFSICSNPTHPSVLGTDGVSSGWLPVPCLCYQGPSSSPLLSYQFYFLSLLEADFNFHKTVLFYLLEEGYGGAMRNFPMTTFS